MIDTASGGAYPAFVQTRGGTGDSSVLAEHLGPRVSHYKVPESWVFVEELPMTTSGKVARHRLLELWEDA